MPAEQVVIAPKPISDEDLARLHSRTPHPASPRYVCPHCDAYAAQSHFTLGRGSGGLMDGGQSLLGSLCASCNRLVVWLGERILWPTIQVGMPPHPEMPESARAIYEEARQVAGLSSRSAAALLRLATEVLVRDLTTELKTSATLNDRIGDLKRRGLPDQVVQALDVLRVVGNSGVHPGEINLEEQPETVAALFQVLNLVVEQIITTKRQIDELYAILPAGARAGIDKRDAPQVERT